MPINIVMSILGTNRIGSIQKIEDINNSSSIALLSGTTFNGSYVDCSEFTSASVMISTDQTGTLYILFSNDAKNEDRKKTYIIDDTSAIHTILIISKYIKIQYTNGGVNQTYFRLNTILHKQSPNILISTLDQTIKQSNDAFLVRSVLMGQTESGEYKNIAVEGFNNSLNCHITDPNTVFGQISTSINQPQFQSSFVYGINTNMFKTTLINTGTVTTLNQYAFVQTGVGAPSSALLESIQPLVYRPGQGACCLYTAAFSVADVNFKLLAGIGDNTNGFFIGIYLGIFSIVHRVRGVDNVVNQSSFNVDKLDGTGGSGITINPVNFNIYRIRYQYLGAGQIVFEAESSSTGDLFVFHKIDYTNKNINTSLSNPNLGYYVIADKSAGVDNGTVKTASVCLYTEGEINYTQVKESVDNVKTAVSTITSILTLQNKSTFAAVSNKVRCRIINMSVSCNSLGGTAIATLRLIKNATLGGVPAYTDIDANNSPMAIDIAGTTVTNGRQVFAASLQNQASFYDLSNLNVFIFPGETLTAACLTSSGNANFGISINYQLDGL